MPTLGIAIDSRKATIGAEEAKKAIRKVRKETGQLDRAQKKLAAQMAMTGKAAKASGGMIGTAFAGIGVIGGLTKMIRTISSLDEAMARLQGVTGQTDEQMRVLEQTARRLGATTSFTAGQAADGMLMLARAGFTANEVVKATGPVLDLAKVAGVSLEQSSTLLADSLKQFGLEAAFAAQAADQLTMASNSTNTSIEQLGEGLKLAGPVAAAAGIDMAETSAILGILADNGLKATLGGTGLRAVLASLAQPSTAATAALQRLGVDTATLTDKIQTRGGLLEVMKQLGPETMNMADAIEIFSRRGASAALTLGRNTDRWQELTAAINDSNGVTRESAALIEDTLGDSFKTLLSAVDEAILSIGESGFARAVQSLVQYLTEGVRALTSLDTGLTRTGASAAAFILALAGGAALAAIRRMTMALWGIVRGPMAAIKAHPIMAAVTAVTLLVEGFVLLANKAKFTTEEMKKFNEAVKASNEMTASLEMQFKATEMFTGERVISGRIKSFAAMQSEAMNLIGLLEERRAGGQRELPRGMLEQFGRTATTMGTMPRGLLRAASAGAEMSGLTGVETQAMIDELKRIVLIFERRQKTEEANLRRVQAPEAASESTAPALDPKFAEAQKAFNETLQEMRDANALLAIELKRGANVAEEEAAVLEVRNALTAEGVELHYAQEDAIRKAVQQQQELNAAIERNSDINELLKAQAEDEQIRADNLKIMRIELEQGTLAARQAAAVMQAEAELKRLGITITKEQTDAIIENLAQQEKVTEELKKQAEEKAAREAFAEDLARGLVMPLREALLSGDFSQVGHAMYMNLVTALLDELAIKPLVNALKSVFSTAMAPAANGMALSGGVQRFASGGVVQSATTFGMAGGRTGLMGEAGPEAIMPLKRLPSGRLGVEAQGGGTTINDNRRITIQVQDDAGFRRTMRQLDRDQARRLDKGMK